ncbi:hypothetical protein PHYSODRAFT_330299 [Phytophthora sojae]|uniref:Peptidase A2 domain-containing protein n=1 Tax=Phytophthora sojae (strain P6497) TaxID=1094619 RepID=G4Z7Z1_PHYSP|nr:hypothetical protein PHYSODRAFT_330299 [Phytophthora sojae]EGZ22526.1 hypothetical protein PHYSODRAFT_330299 [Phytophthora sojae]|eukprot:XP_009525243.1 hypothetical protein PHYSODRAFT_330299 [Phytophthora sojae]
MREGGRGGRGRGEASRQSRRAAGLPPEEQPILEEVQRNAQRVNAEKRKAALAGDGFSNQVQPAPEPAVPDDAHQVSKDGEPERADAGDEPKTAEGDPGQGEPNQASEGGADVDEPQAEDVQPNAQVSAEPKPTLSAEEEKPAAVPAKAVTQLSVKASRGNPPVELPAEHSSVQAAKTYAALQTSRWERARPGFTLPPNYLASKVASQDPVKVWLADLAPSRRDLSTAQDLAGVQIPTGLLDSRECVAVLQTLLFEDGFQFVNVVPAWVEMRVSKLAPMSIRTLVGDVQRLLAVELIEWRELVVGATFKVLPALEGQAKTEKPPIMDCHAKDADGDLLINDYEILLGRTYRPQHAPPRAESSLASPPSQFESLPSEFPSVEGSARDAPARGATSDPVPSIVGTSDRASYGATSEPYVSRNSTSDSSISTLGYSAASHMPMPQLGSWRCGQPGDIPNAHVNEVPDVSTLKVITRPIPIQVLESIQALVPVHPVRTDKPVGPIGDGGDGGVDLPPGPAAWCRAVEAVSTGKDPGRDAEAGLALAKAQREAREAERRAQELERHLHEVYAQASQAASQSLTAETNVEAARLEAARTENERVEAAAAEYIRRQLAEADAKHAAEMAARVGQAQQDLAALAARLQASEVVRAQERESAQNIQRFHVGQIRDLQATSAQAQPERGTSDPNRATPIQMGSDNPERATGVITGNATVAGAQPGQKNTTEAGWEQLLATLPEADVALNAAHRSTTATQVAPTGTSRPGTKTADDRKKAPHKERRRDRDSSPDSGSSSSSSDDDSSSSDDSLDDEDTTPTVESTTIGDGKTSWTFRRYVNSSMLGQFDEKAPLGDRRTWWEKFTNISVQGGWSDQTKVRALKMKLSPVVRNWRGQLEKHVQSNWKRFVQEFRRKYLKLRTSESERYYTMRQKTSETPMEFFYRLNEAAVKAGIKYRKSKKERKQHVKRFLKNLRDSQLKAILANQKIHSLDDLEDILEQQEDLNVDGGMIRHRPGGTSERATSRIPVSSRGTVRLLQLRTGRESGYESEGRVCFEDEVEEAKPSQAESKESSRIEVILQSGQRYGWWEDHEPEENHEVTIVHGAVNDLRTRIRLDTGASGSMISLDLARRLKLKFRMLPEPIRVSGLGGAPTNITSYARVKITLGFRVVYVMSVWLANIGEGLEVLLGMNFIYAAGVRLSVREGLVQLPDEETVVMCDGPRRDRVGLDLPVTPDEGIYLRPGEHAIVKIVYATKSLASSVKVVNISKQRVWIDNRTPVTRIVEFGHFPRFGRFVRPGSKRYQEWQQLIYENTVSPEAEAREQEHIELEWSRQPPTVEIPQREWPTRIPLWPESGSQTDRLVMPQQGNTEPRAGSVEGVSDGDDNEA